MSTFVGVSYEMAVERANLFDKGAWVERDYHKLSDDELELHRGEVIMNATWAKEGWWRGNKWGGPTGLFPSSHVKLLDDSPADRDSNFNRAPLRSHFPETRSRLEQSAPAQPAASSSSANNVNATQYKSRPADTTQDDFLRHCSGERVSTDAVITGTLRARYPHKLITVVPTLGVGTCSLLAYAAAGHASASAVDDAEPMTWHTYIPPARRFDGNEGAVGQKIVFGKYKYAYGKHDFLLYLVDARDGSGPYPNLQLQYVVGGTEDVVEDLILKAGSWAGDLHEQIWVYDQAQWHKDSEMYATVSKAKWSNVILDASKKKAIQDDVLRFFAGQEKYKRLGVPWKRGVIYYGPPGNGKTISIKALMNQLAHLDNPIPALYVRSLAHWGGPQMAVAQIFAKARQTAPCLLIFEDLDSIISDNVRSYFLNEVDGLQSNDGIFMIGSTNHLDRLDPGVSRRPSRFDRKYEFALPTLPERIQYCDFWRHKLAGNEEGVEFPKALSEAIAKITGDFSFAFMQEAFVASLLAIAAGDEDDGKDGKGIAEEEDEFEEVVVEMQALAVVMDDGSRFDDLVLWRQMKKQVEILRKEL